MNNEEKTSEFGFRLLTAFNFAPKNQIAALLGVKPSALTNYLQGRIPDADLLQTISVLTKRSIHWLVTGEGTTEILDEKRAGLINISNLTEIIREIVKEEIQQNELFKKTLSEIDFSDLDENESKVKDTVILKEVNESKLISEIVSEVGNIGGKPEESDIKINTQEEEKKTG